jgi:methyl-accepting chemotaxis protein
VRKLADRSSTATREIGGLIGDVQSGIKPASEAMERSVVQVGTNTDRFVLPAASKGSTARLRLAA